MVEGEERMERGEIEALIVEKVRDISSAIGGAKHVGDVICALHSLAVRLFPVDSSVLCGSLDECYKNQVLGRPVPLDSERDAWRHAFYGGAGFSAMAKILIYMKQVYDSFFVGGPLIDIIQALVPALIPERTNEHTEPDVMRSNVERLLVLCLIETEGVHRMVREFGQSCGSDEHAGRSLKSDNSMLLGRAAQLLASIPDKASLKSSTALSSHVFFRGVVIQLLSGAEERALELHGRKDAFEKSSQDGSFIFVGETFSRLCRRGAADVLSGEMIPRILKHIRSCLESKLDSTPCIIESKPNSLFWLKMMVTVRDQYAVERLTEELLRQLSTRDISDIDVYWMLWMLFRQTFHHQMATRAMFVDKFLLRKVFPINCLRWILQFSVFNSPPAGKEVGQKANGFPDTIQCLVSVWSKREFVQSAPMEQQAYITAAIGYCLERMSREELETTTGVLHSILQGVSCRLESPIHLVRKMASSIALVFSKVVDPDNPLYLDDDCHETVDWEFGLISTRKETTLASPINGGTHNGYNKGEKDISDAARKKDGRTQITKGEAKYSEFRLVDPDEVVDPAMLNGGYLCGFEDDDGISESSEASSDSSLQPYDLRDDDTDLEEKFTQLTEISVALRKPDDPDGVERALDVAEKLIRASPDELSHSSGDLVRALVHVRCSDVTIEGKEESAEGKRQKALIALLVRCPFESLDVLTKLLYSPNVDVGQRILIIDVMIEAAQELADAKTMRVNSQHDLISMISESQPGFISNNRGPPGAGPWKEVSEMGTSLSWSQRYERELPSRSVKAGKSRRWSLQRANVSHLESVNRFPLYAALFMLPAMQGFDKRRHGVDFLGRDFIVLGKLIYMLGVCMKCMAMHPEASALAPSLLDMLRFREVSQHPEAYVRRSVLFTASCILVALHPSNVASALIEDNQEISNGLEWIRTWALYIAESDPDTECSSVLLRSNLEQPQLESLRVSIVFLQVKEEAYFLGFQMAMGCLQLHAEMALQASRSLESADSFTGATSAFSSKTSDIVLPFSRAGFQM